MDLDIIHAGGYATAGTGKGTAYYQAMMDIYQNDLKGLDDFAISKWERNCLIINQLGMEMMRSKQCTRNNRKWWSVLWINCLLCGKMGGPMWVAAKCLLPLLVKITIGQAMDGKSFAIQKQKIYVQETFLIGKQVGL